MKLAAVIGTAILSLTLGASSAAYAQDQHDQQEEQKDKPAEKKAQPEKPAKQDDKTAQQQDKNSKQDEKNMQDEKSMQQQDKNNKQDDKNAQRQDMNNKPDEKNAQQPTQEARPGEQAQRGGGGSIPADRYKANFGQGHTFRVSQGDYNNHSFQYGGYSFGFVGAWPSNWLYTQDVYVIDIDGVYYLCNAMYPGVNIALSVTL